MALKKRFREATRNEFFSFCFSSVLSDLRSSVFLSFSVPVYLFAVLQTLSLLFPCKNFWAVMRNISPSCKSLFAVEENYFNRVLTSLIILWWGMYEGSFQVCDGRWWKKILECQTLKLGDAPCTPNKYSRRLKHLSLGVPPCIPLSINNH